MPSLIGTGVVNLGFGTGLTTALNIPDTGTNRCLVVGTFVYSSASFDISGVTYNGVAMTPADSSYGTLNDSGYVRFWRLLNPPVGASYNIAQTVSGGSAEEIGVVAAAFSDVDQTTPFGTQAGTNGANATTSTGTVSISGSDLALAMWSGYDASSAITLTPNGTGIVEDENDQFTGTSLGFQYRANGTLGWTMSPAVDAFQQLSIPLRHVATGGRILRPAGGMSGGMQRMSGGMG